MRCAYALADDLTRVKRATDAIESRALVHRAWRPAFLYGCGEHHRIRGDLGAALAELEAALALAAPGAHQVWPFAAGAQLRTLLSLGRHEEVKALGARYLARAEACGLGYVRNYLRMPLSLALSKLGQHTEAAQLAQSVLDELSALGSTGLNLAAAYETRARIELERGDRAGSEVYAALSAEQWRSGRKRMSMATDPLRPRSLDREEVDEISVLSQFSVTLETCSTASQRARCGLEYLGRHSGALGGLLYVQTDDGLACRATFGEVEPSVDLDAWANKYFEHELDESEATDVHDNPPDAALGEHAVSGGRRYVPVLLTHQAPRGVALTGLALLVTTAAAPFTYPSRVASELSRVVSGAGDALTSYV